MFHWILCGIQTADSRICSHSLCHLSMLLDLKITFSLVLFCLCDSRSGFHKPIYALLQALTLYAKLLCTMPTFYSSKRVCKSLAKSIGFMKFTPVTNFIIMFWAAQSHFMLYALGSTCEKVFEA